MFYSRGVLFEFRKFWLMFVFDMLGDMLVVIIVIRKMIVVLVSSWISGIGLSYVNGCLL